MLWYYSGVQQYSTYVLSGRYTNGAQHARTAQQHYSSNTRYCIAVRSTLYCCAYSTHSYVVSGRYTIGEEHAQHSTKVLLL